VSQHSLEKDGSFVIHDYNDSRPWASFFPGIAGLFGIPLWVFYVNRGQCISSVGLRSKDEAIMEFLPANKAYQLTSTQGFRTFIKLKNNKKSSFYEPFSICQKHPRTKNKMIVRPHELMLVEENDSDGLKVEVTYFSLCNEPYAGLVREVVITNRNSQALDIELLDGLSVIIPYGINNFFLKEMSRTIEAWMTVENIDTGVPLYKLTTDPRDSAQVAFVKGGNFYTAFGAGDSKKRLNVIVDPQKIFGNVCDFSHPVKFTQKSAFAYPRDQVAKNKTPCAFSYLKTKIPAKGSLKLFSLIGHVFDVRDIKKYGIDKMTESFIEKKKKENASLINSVMDRIFTSSGSLGFDLYARQTFLDNCLRGGLPYAASVNGEKRSVYVYSRKHGDLERDYNRFFLSATYFSEGEGNYRDVNQNRRSDVFFNPLVGEKNIMDFMNCIQLDGYNPLIFKGDRFIISLEKFQNSDLSKTVPPQDAKKLWALLSKPFVIGEVLRHIEESKIALKCSLEDFVKMILKESMGEIEAAFGEGYWTDHWSYNTDLLESFYAIYPDQMKHLLFNKKDFTYFDTHVFVKPRIERYVVRDGAVKQYHAVGNDEAKNTLIHKRHEEKNKVRIQNGDGSVYRTTLIEKLLCLMLNKLATLDPSGIGIEMEADKPNWYDALNGLPGLLGSSSSETFELKRLILFLKKLFAELNVGWGERVVFFKEGQDFFNQMMELLKKNLNAFDFWDASNSIKEQYRLRVRRGLSGEPSAVTAGQVNEFFDLALNKINSGLSKSHDAKTGFYYTYFSHEVVAHDTQTDASGKHCIRPKEFKQHRLPLFLEGFVHALRTEHDKAALIYRSVQKSPLWDKKLKMYKVNASLENESFELGRAKAFTPGWLENESIWLHMEYKYLLEFLKNGLFEIFYDDFFNVLIPFQDARRYGRSTLENSSFIASSIHPDSSLHGAGFVARLSGSTAEFLQMWLLMNVGEEPFFVNASGQLNLRFRPALIYRLFSKKAVKKDYTTPQQETREVSFASNSYGFLFLGNTLVTYLNPLNKNTYGPQGVVPREITLFDSKGEVTRINGSVIGAPYAQWVREGKISRVEILLGKK